MADNTIMPAADVLSDKVRAFQLDQEAPNFLQNASKSPSFKVQHVIRYHSLRVHVAVFAAGMAAD